MSKVRRTTGTRYDRVLDILNIQSVAIWISLQLDHVSSASSATRQLHVRNVF